MANEEPTKAGRPSKRKAIEAWLAREQPPRITIDHWRALSAEHAPIAESYLRKLLRDSGVPLDPLVDGVRQDSFDSLESSLESLLGVYEQAKALPDRRTTSACRKAVISGKDHARWAAERTKDPEQKAIKQEMADWMLVWLENPPLFPSWVRLRRMALGHGAESVEER